MFSEMTLGKRIAWNIIYHDYIRKMYPDRQAKRGYANDELPEELIDQQELLNGPHYK